MTKDISTEALLARCKRAGVPVDNIWHPQAGIVTGDKQRELLQLVLNVEAANRAKRVLWLALASAVASAFSAAAAWFAVASHLS